MDAPKKIYICPSDLAGIDYDEEWLEFPWGDNNIEYTRTDVFIDKACEWLIEHKEAVETEDNGIMGWIPDYFIEDFRKAMEE